MSRILVVDDEVKECELLKRFLESKGNEYITKPYDMKLLDSGK